MKRYSRQREVILNNLKERCDHPTAEMVYDSVKEEIPNISLGTVYRNLKGLTEDKEILSFTHGGKEHFDGNADPHVHICCLLCDSIEDRILKEDEFAFNMEEGFRIKNVIIQGFCSKCTGNAGINEI